MSTFSTSAVATTVPKGRAIMTLSPLPPPPPSAPFSKSLPPPPSSASSPSHTSYPPSSSILPPKPAELIQAAMVIRNVVVEDLVKRAAILKREEEKKALLSYKPKVAASKYAAPGRYTDNHSIYLVNPDGATPEQLIKALNEAFSKIKHLITDQKEIKIILNPVRSGSGVLVIYGFVTSAQAHNALMGLELNGGPRYKEVPDPTFVDVVMPTTPTMPTTKEEVVTSKNLAERVTTPTRDEEVTTSKKEWGKKEKEWEEERKKEKKEENKGEDGWDVKIVHPSSSSSASAVSSDEEGSDGESDCEEDNDDQEYEPINIDPVMFDFLHSPFYTPSVEMMNRANKAKLNFGHLECFGDINLSVKWGDLIFDEKTDQFVVDPDLESRKKEWLTGNSPDQIRFKQTVARIQERKRIFDGNKRCATVTMPTKKEEEKKQRRAKKTGKRSLVTTKEEKKEVEVKRVKKEEEEKKEVEVKRVKKEEEVKVQVKVPTIKVPIDGIIPPIEYTKPNSEKAVFSISSGIVVDAPDDCIPSSLCCFKFVPGWVMVEDLMPHFKHYATTNNMPGMREQYPIIRIQQARAGKVIFVEYDPRTRDAMFALNMVKKVTVVRGSQSAQLTFSYQRK